MGIYRDLIWFKFVAPMGETREMALSDLCGSELQNGSNKLVQKVAS